MDYINILYKLWFFKIVVLKILINVLRENSLFLYIENSIFSSNEGKVWYFLVFLYRWSIWIF